MNFVYLVCLSALILPLHVLCIWSIRREKAELNKKRAELLTFHKFVRRGGNRR